jgi:hypothetical protein
MTVPRSLRTRDIRTLTAARADRDGEVTDADRPSPPAWQQTPGEVMDKYETPADTHRLVAGVTEAAAGMLPMAAAGTFPLDMAETVAELLDPTAMAREMPWLARAPVKVVLGRSDIAFGPRDRRFADEAWQASPYFRVLGQSYRLFEMWMDRMCENVDVSWQNEARARFAADVLSAALSSANYLATNVG